MIRIWRHLRGSRRVAFVLALGVISVFLQSEPALAAPPATLRTPSVPVGFGQLQDTGLTLKAAMSASDTTIHFSDNSVLTTNDFRWLKVGMVIRIQNDASSPTSEQMLITGLSDSLPDPLGLSEAPPYADTATVLRGQAGTTAVAHAAGLIIRGHYVKVPIEAVNVAHRDTGTLTGALGSSTTQNSGAKLLDAITTNSTILNVTDATLLVAGTTITIDSEQMAVGATQDSLGDGFGGITETALGSDPATLLSSPESPVILGTCTDGIDNDLTGGTDSADAGCATANGDGDGFTDAVETALGSSPSNASQTPEHSARAGSCSDALDNDGDGGIDGADVGCDQLDVDGDGFNGAIERALLSNPAVFASTPEMLLVGGSCADGVDNDSDGVKDARETACIAATGNSDNDDYSTTIENQFLSNPGSSSSTPEHAAFPASCEDAVDNDAGGGMDAADVGCDDIDVDNDGFSGFSERSLGSNPGVTASTPESPIVGNSCTDGLNNDQEGGTDAADPGCATADTDGDGFTNAVETALGSDPAMSSRKPESQLIVGTCTDGIDNDADGQTNGADAGCDDMDADGDGWSGALERVLVSNPANAASSPESVLAGNSCADGIDNDLVGGIDALDTKCPPTADADTWADVIETALGSNMSSSSSVPEHALLPLTCADGVDNDVTGGTDADDTGCSSLDVDADYAQVVRAQNGTTAAAHSANAVITENVVDVPVSDSSLVGVGSVMKIDNEKMLVKGTRPGFAEVTRAVNGSSVASHSSGAAIQDIDGLGAAELTFSIDRTYADVVMLESGGFLSKCTTDTDLDGTVCDPGDSGRVADCGTDDGDLGLIENSGATLLSGINATATTLSVSDHSLFRPGMRLRLDSEDIVVRSISEGSPDTLIVFRSATPAAHNAGTAIFAQNTALNGIKFTCTTSSPFPFNYGPIGTGAVGIARLMPIQRTPPTPTPSLQLSSQELLDISSDSIASTLTSGKLTVAKCPDPNLSGKITQADYLTIARAAFNIIPQNLELHDLNGNGFVADEDRLIAARILYIYSIPIPDCAPVP
jgi:hypothetical protein